MLKRIQIESFMETGMLGRPDREISSCTTGCNPNHLSKLPAGELLHTQIEP
jgi:hypothetical protein